MIDSDSDGAQFTLTCISTGGPSTTVTWIRDSTTITEGTVTVLDDPVTAQYTHTLTVTKRHGGLYTCSITNAISSVTSSLLVQGIYHAIFPFYVSFTHVIAIPAALPPTNLEVVQTGPTSAWVTWSPSPVETTTGYRIYYTTSNFNETSQGVDITTNSSTTTYMLTGLVNGVSYCISVLATSRHLSSTAVDIKVTLGMRHTQAICVVAQIMLALMAVTFDLYDPYKHIFAIKIGHGVFGYKYFKNHFDSLFQLQNQVNLLC